MKAKGKKKLLLEIKRHPEKREELVATLKKSPNRPQSPQAPEQQDSHQISKAIVPLVKSVGPGLTSTRNLDYILDEDTELGNVARKITEAAIRYRRERDSSALNVFQTNSLTYDEFRQHLYRSFQLRFSDDEFTHVIKLFDNNQNENIDGSEFLVCFTKFATIHKSKQAAKLRERQAEFLKSEKEKADRKQRELEKKNQLSVDYKYTPSDKESALQKMTNAAKKYDKNHPSAVSLDGFNGASLFPHEFRDLLKRIFYMTLTPKELGVLIHEFDKNKNGKIDCSEFLLTFFKMGYAARAQETKEQLERQRSLNEEAITEEEEKLIKAQEKNELKLNFDFSEADEARMHAKMLEASKKYDRNHPASVAPDGFDVLYMTPGVFREMVKRTFNLHLSGKELGAAVKTFDKAGNGKIACKDFLLHFFQLGHEERDRERVEQLKRQRELNRIAEQEQMEKLKQASEKSQLKLTLEYSESDKSNMLEKLKAAATKYDRTQTSALGIEGFEASFLTPGAFKEMLKRTFNLNLSIEELAALVDMYKYNNEVGKVDSVEFIKAFLKQGIDERAKIHIESIMKQRKAEEDAIEEKKRKALEKDLKKQKADIDYTFTDEERDHALQKMADAAIKFDRNHPSAPSLSGFEVLSMTPLEFKDMVARTFKLHLSPKELGAVVKHFDSDGYGTIICSEFLNVFFKLGFNERSKWHREQIIAQREAERRRLEEHQRKIQEQEEKRHMKIDYNFTDSDLENAIEKITDAAAKYDRNHPAAVGLDGFNVAYLTPGEFREVVQRTFRINLTAKELAALLSYFHANKDGNINSAEFLTKFFHIGKNRRDKIHKESIEKQRLLDKIAKKEAEDKLAAQLKKVEDNVQIDWNFSNEDDYSATMKLVAAAAAYDRSSKSAPSMEGFSANYIGPGTFRELLKRTFNLRVTDKELGALVMKFQHAEAPKNVDCRMFEINFLQIGINERRKAAVAQATLQRQQNRDREINNQKKLQLLVQKSDMKIDYDYGEVEKSKAKEKLIHAAFKYDKTMPGSVSVTAFDALYLTPGQFREILKRTFNLKFNAPEFGVICDMFDKERSGRIISKEFLDEFCRIGIAERDKMRLVQIEKNRIAIKTQKQEHIRKILDAEKKMEKDVREEFTEEEQRSAFNKLIIAATKYDRNHPAAVSLDGFNALHLTYGQFRELVKRTFGVVLNDGELSAIVNHFDPRKNGYIVSKEFTIYFCKLGISEREKFQAETLRLKRQHKLEQEREEKEKLEAQWAKMELDLDMNFSSYDKENALKKFVTSAALYDPTSALSMDLSAFDVVNMTAAVFREMCKRVLNIKLTGKELGAMIDEFNDGHNRVDCQKFLIKFTSTGLEERAKARRLQREKNIAAEMAAKEEMKMKEKQKEVKVDTMSVDWDFSHSDFSTALQKIKQVAATYDKNHPSAVGLEGFQGASLKPSEFREVLKRTFGILLTSKELGATVKFFDSDGDGTINTAEFLKHFYKLQRVERSVIRKQRIQAEKDVAAKLKHEVDLRVQKKALEEEQLMSFNETDEKSLMKKLEDLAQIFAVDSSSFVGPLQAFKGPALPPVAFREVFYRIFQVKLTYPEIGALMSVMDESGTGSIDGKKFCNAFFRLGRLAEKQLMGELNGQITIDSLRPKGVDTPLLQSTSKSHLSQCSSAISAVSSGEFGRPKSHTDLKNVAIGADGSEIDMFSSVTVGKSWVLPSAVKRNINNNKSHASAHDNEGNSVGVGDSMFEERTFDDFEPFILVSRKPGSAEYRPNLKEYPMPETGPPKSNSNGLFDRPRDHSPSRNNNSSNNNADNKQTKNKSKKNNYKFNFEDIKIKQVGKTSMKPKETYDIPPRSASGNHPETNNPNISSPPSNNNESVVKHKKLQKKKSQHVKSADSGVFFFPALLSSAPTLNLAPVGHSIIEQENIMLYEDTESF